MSRGAKEEPGPPLSGVPFGVRDPVKLSSQPYRFRDGMQVRQRKGARGEKKSHLKKKRCSGKKKKKKVWAEYRWGVEGSVRTLPRTPFTAHLWPRYRLPRRPTGWGEEWTEGKWGSEATSGLKVGHVARVEGCRGRGHDSGRQTVCLTERQAVIMVYFTIKVFRRGYRTLFICC